MLGVQSDLGKGTGAENIAQVVLELWTARFGFHFGIVNVNHDTDLFWKGKVEKETKQLKKKKKTENCKQNGPRFCAGGINTISEPVLMGLRAPFGIRCSFELSSTSHVPFVELSIKNTSLKQPSSQSKVRY